MSLYLALCKSSFKDISMSIEGEGKDIVSAGGQGEKKDTGSVFHRFDGDLKTRFLALAPKLWPNIGKLCRAVGISRQTYYGHLESDPEFYAAMMEARESRLDDLEEANVNEGAGTGREAFLPRISTLKAYRRKRYDPAKVLKVEGYKMAGPEEKAKRLGAVDRAIDTEIVKTYEDRKERNQVKQQQRQERLEAGEERTGGGGG